RIGLLVAHGDNDVLRSLDAQTNGGWIGKAMCKGFGLELGDGLVRAGLLFFQSLLLRLHPVAPAKPAKPVLIMYRKSIGAHGGEAFGKFLFHRIDGRIDAYERHDPESDDRYRNACAQFIAPDRPEGQVQRIAELHVNAVLPLIYFILANPAVQVGTSPL